MPDIIEEYFSSLEGIEMYDEMDISEDHPIRKHAESVIAKHSSVYADVNVDYYHVCYWIFLLSKNPNCDELAGKGITYEGKGRNKIIDCHYSNTTSPVIKIRSALQKAYEDNRLTQITAVLNEHRTTVSIAPDRFTGDTLWLHTPSGKINCGIVKEVD